MKNQELFSRLELQVLKCLNSRLTLGRGDVNADIGEISYITGVGDSEEVVRALYTLEGRRLVQPDPEGDFTSNYWRITQVGRKALKLLHC